MLCTDSSELRIRLCNEDYGTNITIPQGGSNEMDILTTVAIMLYSIIFLLGIIGNGLVIWISAFRMKRIISAVWFLNLAIADFLCINPIIYVFMGQDFRHSFLRSIPIRLERALSEHPDDPHEEEDHEHTTDS
ncbi:hypothetical protein GDO81_014695 [Engystomops pustulosus]|uniref:G-protein coupled receptors family 1 profile domain-containing protein n=1 Tax=Engystomops pustulosus TaxID=76066 RepID=A0AAV7BC57_ENGPU|nr:hypothetical protein GDO81_014695 [Engystomops pustulosus]